MEILEPFIPGFEHGATNSEIKKAYRRLSVQYNQGICRDCIVVLHKTKIPSFQLEGYEFLIFIVILCNLS